LVPILTAGTLLAGLLSWNLLRWVVLPGAESVWIPAGDHQLAGTLVHGRGRSPRPAVLVLHGSGPDRGTGLGYRVQANALRRSGASVLLYNKRGVGRSGGDFASASYEDFIDDALAAVRYLSGRGDVEPGRIGILGASEGGWLAPEVAARSGDAVAFVVVKSGSPLSWQRTVQWEVRKELEGEGFAGAELDALLELQRRVWDHYVAVAEQPALARGTERDRLDAELGRVAARLGDRMPLRSRLPDYDEALYRRLGGNAAYDPAPFLAALSIPMLYVFGADDVNVPVEESVVALSALRAANPRVEWEVCAGQGHDLQSWNAPFTAGFDPRYLRRMAEFVRATTSPPDVVQGKTRPLPREFQSSTSI
jgi:pimeloyl-ACP methyl ester carboxylesterase